MVIWCILIVCTQLWLWIFHFVSLPLWQQCALLCVCSKPSTFERSPWSPGGTCLVQIATSLRSVCGGQWLRLIYLDLCQLINCLLTGEGLHGRNFLSNFNPSTTENQLESYHSSDPRIHSNESLSTLIWSEFAVLNSSVSNLCLLQLWRSCYLEGMHA